MALPPKHPFASRPRLELSALANEPFILPPRDAVPVFHEAVRRACHDAGFVPQASHEVDRLQMVLRMVAAGAGVALVPAAARKITQGPWPFGRSARRPTTWKWRLRGGEQTPQR